MRVFIFHPRNLLQIAIGEGLRDLHAVMRLLSRDAERTQRCFACCDEAGRSEGFDV
ncbi:MAG: hypothetical protein QOI77_2263 [Blastocatellia bacterium]|nr:hypothetical protein [Blastocatellia bacterium]